MNEQPVTQLIGFLRSSFGSQFKEYYDGDPDNIPKANLPCIVVVKLSDDMRNDGTGLQRVVEEFQVKVIYNKEDDWTPDVDPTKLTERKIRDIVESRDSNGGYDKGTIKYALMNRFRYNGIGIDQSMRFELGVLPRSDDLVTEEGHLTITLNYLVKNAVHS